MTCNLQTDNSSLLHEEPLWYCLRSKPRQEALAARFLRQLPIEVFAPRLLFKKPRVTGMAMMSEALFPGYLFARFAYLSFYRQIMATRGIVKIIHFGDTPKNIPDEIITTLRKEVNEREIIEITDTIIAGDEVNIVSGPFYGLQALVTRLLPCKERVAILMQLLGEEREIEVSREDLLSKKIHPLNIQKQHTKLIF